MTMQSTTLSVDKLLVTQEALDRVARFTGYDDEHEHQTTDRCDCPNDFTITVKDEEGDTEDYNAWVVECNDRSEGRVPASEPVAIGMTIIDGVEYYLLIRRGDGALNTGLMVSGTLITYEGDPKELLQKTHLFHME